MITVEEATSRLLSLVGPLGSEIVPLREATGRVLAGTPRASRSQPPFAAAAMDGYAIAGPAPSVGDRFEVTGEAAAGHPFSGELKPGEAVRIFTGAPLPGGAGRVVIQEDTRRFGDAMEIAADVGASDHIRPAGGDFEAGMTWAPRRALGSRDIALLAAMGMDMVPVVRRPVVAVLMTGDELRAPGESLAPGQITGTNGYGLASMAEDAGADARLLPIARDRTGSLRAALDLAEDADLVVTIGGASVGDHDLVAAAAGDAGLDLAFHKVAMRPGKPLLAGRLGSATMLGLPGNPVSAMVCGVIFMLPMLRRMQGLATEITRQRLPLTAPVSENGPRQHYMRAWRSEDGCAAQPRQDSSLLHLLAEADLLIERPPHDPARMAGDVVTAIALPR